MDHQIALFQEKQIRRIYHNEEWWFSIIDVIEVLTGTDRARKYWSDLKKKLVAEGFNELSDKIGQLKMEATDGKMRGTDAASTEGILRIILSIPSPKAEPFKWWLAQVGTERIEAIENPEIAFECLKEFYQTKGYSNDWIETRLKSIEIRKQLTEEWKNRNVKEGIEYSILTAEISKATFGMTPSEYQKFKGLLRHPLRDHMTNLELIFTMLGEESTKMTAQERNAQGFPENKVAAREGGMAAGKALNVYEKQSKRKVVTPHNFLTQIEKAKTDPPMLLQDPPYPTE
jgi:DNA-damage-inducible protein D